MYQASFKEARNKWREIGYTVGLNKYDLQSMHIVNHGDPGRCYNAMLAKWFESSPNCYFNVFTDALKADNVDLSPAIAKIEEIIYEYAGEQTQGWQRL